GVLGVFYLTGQDVLGWSGKFRAPDEQAVPSTVRLREPKPDTDKGRVPRTVPEITNAPRSAPANQVSKIDAPASATSIERVRAPKTDPGPLSKLPHPTVVLPGELSILPQWLPLPPLDSQIAAALVTLPLDPVAPLDLAVYDSAAELPAKSRI